MADTYPLYVYENGTFDDVHFQTFTDAAEADVHASTWGKRGYGVVLLTTTDQNAETK